MRNSDNEYFVLAGSVVDSIRKSCDGSNTDFASLDSRCQRPLMDPELRSSDLFSERPTQPKSLCLVVSGNGSQLLRGFAEDANTGHLS